MNEITSVLSFPERGPWGSSTYRGNCSGYVYQALFRQLQPKSFADPMMGSGTSIEVAREMGIEAFGFDLRLGFNAVADSLVHRIGKEVDCVVSHPPYGDLLIYSGSGNVWGDEPHPADLSRCSSDEEFHEKLQRVMFNQREATKPGGYYGTLIGDLRRGGRYVSYQAEVIARMPSNELAGVIIKQQHNCVSDSRRYARMALPRIMHEYLILFRKAPGSLFAVLRNVATAAHNRLRSTWASIVHTALLKLGGKAQLSSIYEAVESCAGQERIEGNAHWKAKVRQCLQLNPSLFASDSRGVWGLIGGAA